MGLIHLLEKNSINVVSPALTKNKFIIKTPLFRLQLDYINHFLTLIFFFFDIDLYSQFNLKYSTDIFKFLAYKLIF